MGLTISQEYSIERYTGPYYREINDELRGDATGDAAIALDIYNLDNILATSRIDRTLTVFRGIDEIYARELERLELAVGDLITEKGFLSTSRKPEEAKRFMHEGNSGMLLRIRLHPGCNAFDVSPYSTNPDEQEILLPRETRLKVLGYDADEDVLDLEVATGD